MQPVRWHCVAPGVWRHRPASGFYADVEQGAKGSGSWLLRLRDGASGASLGASIYPTREWAALAGWRTIVGADPYDPAPLMEFEGDTPPPPEAPAAPAPVKKLYMPGYDR